MSISAADVAASIEATAKDIMLAMQTYQKAPKGMKLRDNVLIAVEQLIETLGRDLPILQRKHEEDRNPVA
jgi:hypothetical protein